VSTRKILDGLISRNPDLHNGRPIIAGTGTTVRAIAIMYKQGLTPEDIIGELPVNLAQVYAALTYYHLHTEEIENDILADSEELLIEKYGTAINSVNE
jgi:uncharacterized protein (DUF433 family)